MQLIKLDFSTFYGYFIFFQVIRHSDVFKKTSLKTEKNYSRRNKTPRSKIPRDIITKLYAMMAKPAYPYTSEGWTVTESNRRNIITVKTSFLMSGSKR